MDDSVHRVETKDRVVAVQPKLISCSKQNCNSSKGDGCCTNLTEDRNCVLNPTMPSSKSVSPEDGLDKSTSVSQITSHLKDRLNLKSGVGVNGIINGLGIGVDLSHSLGSEHISNGKALTECSSHCDRCEDCLDNENVIHNPTTLLNCIENQLDNVSRSKEPACCTNVRSKCSSLNKEIEDDINYVSYKSELQMPDIMRLIQKDLSEPYSIYTYRYFIHNWPKLCFLAMDGNECVGAIVCKLDHHRKVVKRGYIAMLAVDEKYRKRKIGSNLVLKAIRAMVADKADEVVLETEITNRPALRLYENLGFVRDKRLFRYYLNGVDALRLKLWLR